MNLTSAKASDRLHLRQPEPADDFTRKWEAQSLKWRSDLGVSPNYSPWTSQADFKGLGLPT